MKCSAKRPATRHNFLDMDHPDAKPIKLHKNDRQYSWHECPHCGCVIGRQKQKRKTANKEAYLRDSVHSGEYTPSQPPNQL